MLEQLIVKEAEKSWEWEEKLQQMQKEIAAWMTRSSDTGTAQTDEQEDAAWLLEVSKGLVEALQKNCGSKQTRQKSCMRSWRAGTSSAAKQNTWCKSCGTS